MENTKKTLLGSLINKNHYFYRTVVFSRAGNKVALADIEHPQQTTDLEEWMGVVISLADGDHTLQELVSFMANQYKQVPEKLAETLESIVERLVESKMLLLSETKVQLPYYLAAPIEHLDLDKAKKLIKEDGYVLH